MVGKKFDDALGASYRLVEKVGQGATGAVWAATDLRTGERVAAKLLYPQHAADRAAPRSTPMSETAGITGRP